MKPLALMIVRLASAMLGFMAAISFMRSFNRAYNFYFSRLIGNWFNFGLMPSVFLLFVCLIVFAFSIILRKGAFIYPLRKVDYLFLLIFCSAGFAICTRIAWTAFLPWWDGQTSLFGYIVILPFFAYCFALLAFGELVARLRDQSLIKTTYWVEFFRVYSPWQPLGFMALSVLFTQIIVMMLFIQLPSVLLVSVFIMGVFTYFAVHMITQAAEYDIASAEKIRGERFKSELITNVSHDIKTPLTSIINYVDLLKTEGLQGQAAGYVDVLHRKSARLKVLIDDLMEASKAGTGNLPVDMQVINLTEMIGQVAGEFEDVFFDKGLTLVTRQPSAVVNILADSRHLYRALENLFANAAKYSLGGTRVFSEIIYMPYQSKALIALQNTSTLPIEISGRDLTEQFIRGDKARQTEGSGLGLYIAKSLVELMDGRLDIHVIGDLFRVEVFLTAIAEEK